MRFGAAIVEALAEVEQLDEGQVRREVGLLLGYSAVILVVALVMTWANFALFGLSAPFGVILFVFVISTLLSYIPIQILGGLGVYEVSAVFLFAQLGVLEAQTLPVVLALRVYFYLLNGVMLLYPLSDLLKHRRAEVKAQT